MIRIRTSPEATTFSFVVIIRSIKDSLSSVTLVDLLIGCVRLKVDARLYIIKKKVAVEITRFNDIFSPNRRDSMILQQDHPGNLMVYSAEDKLYREGMTLSDEFALSSIRDI